MKRNNHFIIGSKIFCTINALTEFFVVKRIILHGFVSKVLMADNIFFEIHTYILFTICWFRSQVKRLLINPQSHIFNIFHLRLRAVAFLVITFTRGPSYVIVTVLSLAPILLVFWSTWSIVRLYCTHNWSLLSSCCQLFLWRVMSKSSLVL
jgi:hypothetical protein